MVLLKFKFERLNIRKKVLLILRWRWRKVHPSQCLELRVERHIELCLFGITVVKTSKLLRILSIFYNAKYLVTIPKSELEYPPIVLYQNFVTIRLNIKLFVHTTHFTFHLNLSNRKSVSIPLPFLTCFFSRQSHKHWLDYSDIIWWVVTKHKAPSSSHSSSFELSKNVFSSSFLNTVRIVNVRK